LGRAEDNAFALLEQMTKYYVSRAKLVSKVFLFHGFIPLSSISKGP
jgi:hypothetical protein